MDFTTLFLAVAMTFGLLTFDAIRTSGQVILEVAEVPAIEKTSIDQKTVENEFAAELNRVAEIVSIIVPLEIRTQGEVGITRALGSLLKADGLARAIEVDLGYRSDHLRLALFTDKGSLGALVTGGGKTVGPFRILLRPKDGESLIEFVRRCSRAGSFHLAPYGTTLHMMKVGAAAGDLTVAKDMSERAKAKLPAIPVSFDRSLLENVDGLITLFSGDVAGAQVMFLRAVDSSRQNWVAMLNAAFTEIQLQAFEPAYNRMRDMLARAPARNHILMSTAHMIQGVALLGLNRAKEADALLEKALAVNPDNSNAWYYRAAARAMLDDLAGAEEMRLNAFQTNDTFENYAEVATLYFLMNWRGGSALIESPFRNPSAIAHR